MKSLINYYPIRSTLIALLLFLSACGHVVTPKPTEIPSTLTVITQTYTPTETITPTITNTPTQTMTPTETEIPVPEYYKGIAPDLYSFTLVMEEQVPPIIANIMANPQLTEPTDKKNDMIRLRTGGQDGVNFTCRSYGETGVVRASIRLKNPRGGMDLWKMIWEFRDPYGSHKYLIGYIGGTFNKGGSDTDIVANRQLGKILGIKKGTDVTMNIITATYILSEYDKKTLNPYAWDITTGAPEKDQKILRAVEQSADSDLLPDELTNITVLVLVY